MQNLISWQFASKMGERERETTSLISVYIYIYIWFLCTVLMKLYIGLSLQREFIDLVLRNDFVNSQWTRMLESGFCVSVPPQPPRCSSGRHNHPRQIPSVIYWRCFQCLKHTQTNTKTLAWRSFVALHLVYIAYTSSPLSPIHYCRSNI